LIVKDRGQKHTYLRISPFAFKQLYNKGNNTTLIHPCFPLWAYNSLHFTQFTGLAQKQPGLRHFGYFLFVTLRIIVRTTLFLTKWRQKRKHLTEISEYKAGNQPTLFFIRPAEFQPLIKKIVFFIAHFTTVITKIAKQYIFIPFRIDYFQKTPFFPISSIYACACIIPDRDKNRNERGMI